MQIKVSLDQINYEYLKNRAEKNRRTMSAELNIILDEVRERLNYLRQQPILHYPEGVRTPLPEERYKSTVQSNQTNPEPTTRVIQPRKGPAIIISSDTKPKQIIDGPEPGDSPSPDKSNSNVKPGGSATPTSSNAKSNTKSTNPTVEEFIAFLDKEEISPKDTSWELFDGIKKQVYPKLDINVFDEAQMTRQERRD